MTSHDLILAFVKRQRRIPTADTTYDTVIADTMNSAYGIYCRRLQSLGAPGMRGTATFPIVALTRDYGLASDFDVLIDDSVRYYTTGTTNYRVLQIVSGTDAELWDAMQSTISPLACRVIAGATGTARKLRLLPAFTESGTTVAYAYWKKPATLAAGVVLELPELGDAVGWNCVANSYDYFRDDDGARGQDMALARAKASYTEALGTLNP